MYIHFDRAFDSLSHTNLLFMFSKLSNGGNFLRKFSKFSTLRFFKVKVGNVRSEYIMVKSGVAQGTFRAPNNTFVHY